MSAATSFFQAHAEPGRWSPSALSSKWTAVEEAAQVVAALAGAEPEALGASNWPALIRDAEPWQGGLIERHVDDLIAVLECGVATLLAINAKGANPAPAAIALWREIANARAAILRLLPAGGAGAKPIG